MPVEVGRDDERTARPADGQLVPGLRLLGPARRRPRVVDRKLDFENVVGRVVAARRVVARQRLRLSAARGRRVGKKQFYVIIEAEAGEPGEVARKRNANHVGRDLVDALDLELTATRLVADAAWRARGKRLIIGGNGKRC